jgi:DNA primase catalytic subunit
MKNISFNGVITTVTSKVDRSLGLRISTPELSTHERAEFMEYQNINSIITVKPLDESPDEILEVEAKMEGKTPSQRLRSVIFILWKQKGSKGIFDNFYRTVMEAAINKVKDKLDDDLTANIQRDIIT